MGAGVVPPLPPGSVHNTGSLRSDPLWLERPACGAFVRGDVAKLFAVEHALVVTT